MIDNIWHVYFKDAVDSAQDLSAEKSDNKKAPKLPSGDWDQPGHKSGQSPLCMEWVTFYVYNKELDRSG